VLNRSIYGFFVALKRILNEKSPSRAVSLGRVSKHARMTAAIMPNSACFEARQIKKEGGVLELLYIKRWTNTSAFESDDNNQRKAGEKGFAN
jgi:hypothetical protein